MAEGNELMTGYLMGATDNGGSNNNGFGISGVGDLVALLVVAGLFGGGGWGFGGFGGGGGAGAQGVVTRADINEGFALQNITGGISAIQNGLCDGFHNMTVGMLNGFNGVQMGFNQIGHQISDCCCNTQNAIQNVRYDMATQACDTRNLIQSVARDITDNQNANTRSLMDFLVQDKISALTAENQSLKFAASQAQQNNYIAATIDAATAELLRRTGHDCPSAAYIVQPPTPVTFPVNGCGQAQFGGNGCNSCGF